MMGGEISAVTAVRCRYGSSSDGGPGPHGERRCHPVIVRVSVAELAYVEQYARAAGGICFDALVANSMLNSAIQGWNTVMAQVRADKDFTRQAAWQVVIDLK